MPAHDATVQGPLCKAFPRAGSIRLARMAIIAITQRSSINVKPLRSCCASPGIQWFRPRRGCLLTPNMRRANIQRNPRVRRHQHGRKKHKKPSAEGPQPNLGSHTQAVVKHFGRKMDGRKIIPASSFCHTSFCQRVQVFGWAVQNLVIHERFSGIALQKNVCFEPFAPFGGYPSIAHFAVS